MAIPYNLTKTGYYIVYIPVSGAVDFNLTKTRVFGHFSRFCKVFVRFL